MNMQMIMIIVYTYSNLPYLYNLVISFIIR